MALGIKSEASGDFLPRIQYDAKAGRLFKVDRSQDSAGNWQNDIEELGIPCRIAVDLENIEVGWIKLDGGVDFQMVKVGDPLPPQPSDKHRQGFRVCIYRKDLGVRHWNHSAKCVIAQMDELHDAWSAQAGKHKGQIPIVTIEKTVPVTTGQGAKKSTNYAPMLAITDWIDRPEAFDELGKDSEDKPAVTPNGADVKQAEQVPAGQEF